MNRPPLALAIAVNQASRKDDEWFDEPDELDRVENALHAIDNIDEPVEAAAVLAYRVARAQGFGEANKRTAFLLARWLLDRNGIDGAAVLPSDDRVVADLLVRAASGHDVQKEIVSLFKARWHGAPGAPPAMPPWRRRSPMPASTTSEDG